MRGAVSPPMIAANTEEKANTINRGFYQRTKTLKGCTDSKVEDKDLDENELELNDRVVMGWSMVGRRTDVHA